MRTTDSKDSDFEDIKFFNNKNNRRDHVRNIKKGPKKVDNLTFTVSDHLNLGGMLSPEKMTTNYPPIEPIVNAKNITSKSVAREPYQGYNNVFTMPGGGELATTSFNRTIDKQLNRSAHINKILRERNQKTLIVNNVLKDPVATYADTNILYSSNPMMKR